MIQKYALICYAFIAFVASGFGQVTIFSENIGTSTAGTTAIAANVFQNSGTLTFTGDADTRNNINSTGYAGASAVRNVFVTNAVGRFFQISGINTSAYTGLTLSFGHHKSTTAANNELVVEVSSDGTNYTPLTYSRATGTGTANWTLITPTGTIPSTTNLRIRFRQTSVTPQFRIDDIILRGVAAPAFDSCLSVDFDDDFGNLPGGFVSTGGANTDPAFYQSGGYSRSLASTQTLRTPAMARPAAIEFYAIGSGAGGQLLTLEYTNNGTNWFPLTTYNVSAAGATFYYDSSASTSAEPVVAYRITSGAATIYIDDLIVYCTCDLTDSGIADITCNDNGTDAITTDDFISFELNPTVVSSSTVYNVSVSSGNITPNMNINYGSPTTFTLQNGSAGGGNVTVTITDGISGGCELDVVISDPGSCSVSTVDWCNVQFPNTTQTITDGDNLIVYARSYEPGVTEAAGQGVGLNAWIGYNTVNNNPNDVSWTWVPATFNVQAGNDDEFQAEIGSVLAPGTYYYASRFQLNGGPFVYGGTGGIWNNDSVQLIVQPDQVNFCNVDFPKTGTIDEGDNHNVFAQAYEPGVTDAAGQGANIETWIGYNTVGIDYEPWQATGWTWIAATYDSDFGNNDSYRAEIGSSLPVGTYYYASRFRLNGSTFSYGGIQSDNVGNFWNAGTFNNGVLTVNTPPVVGCSDLFISEYFEGSSNNKYIEIYNPTSAAINLTGYQLRLYANGAATATSTENLSGIIPSYGTVVYRNSAATIYLGTSTSSAVCNFNGDDAIALFNSGNLIDVIGTIGQDPGTQWTATGYSTLDRTLVRRASVQSGVTVNPATGFPSLDTEWEVYPTDTITYLGSHSSDCQGPTPELQLVDTLAADQNCGYTINFGSQALTTDTDITFDIENIGSADLSITSLNLSGTNSGDFSIVSPTTPFIVTSGNIQTVMLRFTPSANGTRTATLTIDSNDANEGTCTVLLTGVGFTPAPNIRVERNTEALIANGATANVGSNTIFATTDLGDTTVPKLYYVRNGNTANPATADLTVNTITSSNNAEFTLVNVPTLPITLAPDEFISFEIEFSPNSTTPLTRNSTITVTSNDTTDNPYTFGVEGTAGCPIYSGAIAPTSGPVGTEITISSAENLIGASATLNGVPLTTVSSSTGELIVQIPLTVTLGGALTVQLSNGCSFTNTFTLIDTSIQSCEGNGSAPSGLFISQVSDSPTGSLTYIELYNATASAIDFAVTNHSLRIYNNGNTTTFSNIPLTAGIIAQNSTYVVAIGTNDTQCAVAGGNGSLAQLMIATPGVSINFHRLDDVTLGHDFIGLYNSSSILTDAFGTFGDESWAVGLNLDTSGANFTRNVDATLPNTTFSIDDWDIIDWENCAGVDYSEIGYYDFSVGTPPSVNTLMSPTSDCDLSATLTVIGTEGFDGVGDSQELAYQWFYSAPGELGWTAVTNNAIYSGATTNTLDILNTLTLDGYQYYCQVREDDATCYIASNSIKLNVNATIWSAGSWSDGLPDINTIAIIDDNYNTNAGGEQISFSTCNLLVRTGTLTIANNTFVEVENNVSVESNIIVNERGSFKQNNNDGNVTVTGSIVVRKETAPMNNWYEYTYWSSPVVGETIDNALNDATPNRRFWFNAQNFLDQTAETGNNNGTLPGQDDIDDDANDWTLAAGTDAMIPGVGYASTHRSSLFNSVPCNGGPNCQFVYTFEGPFNNGIYNVPVYRNDAELNDINWNFIGNPYPSAISADLFLTANTILDNTIDGAIYLWSQNTASANNANGNEVLNFAQTDYAIINNSGQTAGGDGVPPTRHIPSGQGFFVSLSNSATTTLVSGTVSTADVVFNNQMRVTDNNAQFFRSADDDTLPNNKLWINLTSNNGVFNQVLVSYIYGATDTDDGMYYDATRNLSIDANSILYSLIPNSDKKFAIQGKNPNSLTLDEVIPLGFYTSIEEATIYKLSIAQFEGDFFTNQTVYVKDNLLNLFHDLSVADYSFTSETGEFNERFEIVFQAQTLGIGEAYVQPNDVSIIELTNGHVKFTVGHNLTIQSVEIFDMLGRQLYNLPGSNATEIYNLTNLSQAAYVAKVTLSNGQTITKRAVKRQ